MKDQILRRPSRAAQHEHRMLWCGRLASVLGLLLGADLARAAEPPFSGRVVGVSDGDTIVVLRERDGKRSEEKIRLAEVDTPEKKQAFGQRAKQRTSELVFGKTVAVVPHTRDRYGRLVAEVRLPDGRSLGRVLVEDGLAWHYVQYSRNRELGALEAAARKARRGLWADSSPRPPWEFRRPGTATGPPGGAVGYVRLDPPAARSVIGNRRSRVYHAPGCPGHEQVAPQNRVVFESVADAEKAGFRRAGNCPTERIRSGRRQPRRTAPRA